MPSAKRFASMRETVRNHPVIVSTTAATGGVLLGAFVVVQLLATPQPTAENAGTALASKAAPAKPAAETTGSAPTGESVASADCDQQTWPHLSRACMEEFREKNRVRVISTDKLDKPTVSAIEGKPSAASASSELPVPAPWAPTVASTTPLGPTSTSTPAEPAAQAAPAAPASPATTTAASSVPPNPEPTVKAATGASAAAVPSEPPAANSTSSAKAALDTSHSMPSSKSAAKEAKDKSERVAKKSKRKSKNDIRTPGKQEYDDEDATFASADQDDQVYERQANRRSDRSRGRIVERWTERDYDVPSSAGDGRRRVTVIRRSADSGFGGGFFESLFGN